jgi:hypothetical protein
LVEHTTENRGVAGSIPALAITPDWRGALVVDNTLDPAQDWRATLDERISAKAWEIAKENLGSSTDSPADAADIQMTDICKALVCAYVVSTMSGLRKMPGLQVPLNDACADIDRRYPDGSDAKEFTIDDVYFAVARVAPEIPADVSVGMVGVGSDGFEKIVNAITFELGPIGREVTADLDRTIGRLSPPSGAASGGGCLIAMLALPITAATVRFGLKPRRM